MIVLAASSSSEKSATFRDDALPNHDLRRGALAAFFQCGFHHLGNGAIGLGMRALGLADDDRLARVGMFPNAHGERDFAQERHAEFFCLMPRAAVRKNIRALA